MSGARDRQPQVLFTGDDPQMSQARLLALKAWNIGGTVAASLQDTAARWAGDGYDLLVVDVHSRDFDGIAVCRRLRSLSVNPVLLMAYADDERDHIAAYQAGVDEFIAKPIGLPLFVHKVWAWLRHSWTAPALALQQRKTAGLHLDPARKQIRIDDRVVPLTNLELRLLHLLMAHEGRALSGEQIVPHVWGHDDGEKGIPKNAIYRLRRKIEPDPDAPRYLHTVSGKGYLFSSGGEQQETGEQEGKQEPI